MAEAKLCAVEGCCNPANVPGKSARGYCVAHYLRWRRHGNPLAGGRSKVRGGSACEVEGCDKRAHANGFCPAHNAMFKVHGSPTAHHKGHRRNEIWIESHKGFEGDECLIWPFSRNDHGRGVIGRGGKARSAPRAMCIAAHGEPPTPEHEAAHSCGNGHLGCMSPRHLRWATSIENAEDRDAHGRTVKGERVNTAKLTEDQVRDIRRRLASESGADLGREYGVSSAAISHIGRRKTWRHIT